MKLFQAVCLLLFAFTGTAWAPGFSSESVSQAAIPSGSAAPFIRDIQLNLNEYPGGKIPRYAKLELTFQVDTVATNLQLPFDADPPPGLPATAGVSVDALFTPDNWKTVYTQPAFLFQDFETGVRGGQDWFYPTGNTAWKVRFSPNQAGTWQFKLAVQDAGGSYQSSTRPFSVVASSKKGFIRLSPNDARYFQYEDGTYFPALGYNLNFNQLSWANPIQANEPQFRLMAKNGIRLVRIWLSQWGIYGSAWNTWNSIDPAQHGTYIPYSGLTYEEAYPGSEISLRVDANSNPCMFTGFLNAPIAVKRNTVYRVRVRYMTAGMAGPRVQGKPYGFIVKTGGWLWGDDQSCYLPGTGTAVTSYQDKNTSGWEILEGSLNSGDQDFLPYLYLAMENAAQGKAYIDRIWVQEDLGNGRFGANILSKPWMAHHLYFDQRNSFAFDQVVALAEKYGVTLRPVVLEKNDWIFNRIDAQGNWIPDDSRCRDAVPGNDPPECPGNRWFYGDYRQMTKARWLQQAWWRYLQARWGYSTSIQSWELLNEGDPGSYRHYALADEFGKFMHRFAPDDHLVSTSTWHSFPRQAFWANPQYSHVDFADVHSYTREGTPGALDPAQWTYEASMEYGAYRPGGAGKPVIRGETGYQNGESGRPSALLLRDTQGVWLHNLIWGGINAGGLIESYWYANEHIYKQNGDGSYQFDHRPQFAAYDNFIKGIPLAGGGYQDAGASTSEVRLRVWGQKNIQQGRAHLWIQNIHHTWKNVANAARLAPVSGTVTLTGFEPGKMYTLSWWDPYQPDPARQVLGQEALVAGPDGALTFRVDGLQADLAVKINPTLISSATPCSPGSLGRQPGRDGLEFSRLAACR